VPIFHPVVIAVHAKDPRRCHVLLECDTSAWSDRTTGDARPLTHDKQKAAEAAFRQQPFNPVWSQAALALYAGITAAMR
jgi:hypothetical protein